MNTATPPSFRDAAGCKAWLAQLPLINLQRAHRELVDELYRLSAADLNPLDRAEITEVLREAMIHLHNELVKRCLGKPLPLGNTESDAFAHVTELWQAYWQQYANLLPPLLQKDPALMPVAGVVLQRALYVGRQLAMIYFSARRAVPNELWAELHSYYRCAELCNCVDNAISDPLLPQAEALSCYTMYAHTLLLGLADPYSMSSKQLEWTDRWLLSWSRRLKPYSERQADAPFLWMVDLQLDGGLVPAPPRDPAGDKPSMRFANPDKLMASIQPRLKRLSAGVPPAELGLGQDCSAAAAIELLLRLEQRWCQVPQELPPVVPEEIAVCAGGLEAAYFRLAGTPFAGGEAKQRMPYQSSQEMRMFDPVRGYDPRKEQAERDYVWTEVTARCRGDEVELSFGDSAHASWRWSQIVIVRRSDGVVRVGRVGRVVEFADAVLTLRIDLWLDAAAAFTAQSADSVMKEGPLLPAIQIARGPTIEPALAMPLRSYARNARYKLTSIGVQTVVLTGLVERGDDYELVTYRKVG